MKYKYPIILNPFIRCTLWGGQRLRFEYGKYAPFDNIAETWELSDVSGKESIIRNGPLSGMNFSDYIILYGKSVIGQKYDKDSFPYLIKFIDADDFLSVQVHPDDSTALYLDNTIGKSELWYIIDALPNSELVYGLNDDSTFNINDSVNICKSLNYVKVKSGDVFYIPSGLVHSLGGGITIVEIQQNSDLTYRIYDFDRIDNNGANRELHLDKANKSIKRYSHNEIKQLQYNNMKFKDETCLANNELFRVDILDCTEGDISVINVSDDSFAALVCISGCGNIVFNGVSEQISKGDTIFLPAGLGDVTLPSCKFIKTILPTKKAQ